MEVQQTQPESNVIPLPGPVDPRRTPKLAEALAKAQLEIQNAEKNAEAELVFKDGAARRLLRYADLAAVMNVIREPLAKQGLVLMQFPTTDKDGVTVLGRLVHSSGEYVENSLWLPVPIKTPQGYGSTITYCRRYQASAMIGVAQEDDDGQAAVGGPPTKAPPAPKGQKPKPSGPPAEIPAEWKEPVDQLCARINECDSRDAVDTLMLKSQDFAKDCAAARDVVRKAFQSKRESFSEKKA